jgi:3-oxoacyl-[acyl-carrier protein] reductase
VTDAGVTLITGAASGIGAATARRIAGTGTRLLLHASGRTEAKIRALNDLAEMLRSGGTPVETVFADFDTPGAAQTVVDVALARFGRLDALVANAGFADRTPLRQAAPETLSRSLRGMTEAFFALATAAAEPLARGGAGRIVAISSFVAHRFAEGELFPVTAAAKAGMEALAKALAVELGPEGVTVNCIVPGYTRKDATGHRAMSAEAMEAMAARTPTRRIAEPDDVAALVAFLLGADARQITGQFIHVDGGLCLG